jgi:hypothetical protein
MKFRQSLLSALLAVAVLPIIAAAPAHAQDQDGIRNAFLNRRVWLKVDLPGTQLGIDVYPQYQNPFPNDYDSLLRQYPTAYHKGDAATVTKINFKKDHIEFQLDHGGFGQFGDNTDVTPVNFQPMPQSNDEVELRRKIANDDTNVSDRVYDKELLDDLVAKRQDIDARNKVNAQAATDAKIRNVHDARVHGGSRLNITFSDRVPGNLSVHDVELAVAPFVSFEDPRNGPRPGGGNNGYGQPAPPNVYGQPSQPSYNEPARQPERAPAPAPAPSSNGLQKGMSMAEVHRVLGTPTSTSFKDTELGKATTELYLLGSQVITVTFLDGVLIKSEMTSR